MPIYTKKGDKGETGIYSADSKKNIRLGKDDPRIEAIGAIDELNTYLGIVKTKTEEKEICSIITMIQKDLFTLASILAGSNLRFPITKTKKLERKIDKIEKALPKLTNFIILEGEPLAVHLQYARTLTRKAERRIVSLRNLEGVKPPILIYINRLSDYFFVVSRKLNLGGKRKEVVWSQNSS